MTGMLTESQQGLHGKALLPPHPSTVYHRANARGDSMSVKSKETTPSAPSVRQRMGLWQGKRPALYLHALWLLMGPGVIVMIGDNDAGGVISYAATGATFGAGLFILVAVALIPVTYTVQEMAMRLSAVSQQPFPALVFRYFGRTSGALALTALFAENLLTLMTEFIGMSIGLTVLGLPFWLADVVCAVFVIGFALWGKYWTKERLALGVGALNTVFIVLAVWTRGRAVPTPISPLLVANEHGYTLMLFFIIATVGNAVAPWMIFFQGSAVIDKGMTRNDLHFGRLDTALGSMIQAAIAVAIMVCGATLYGMPGHGATLTGPGAMLQGFLLHDGVLVRDLFALGMVNAGFLAAIAISLSTSWTFASVLGFAHSLDDRPRQAPKFYALYTGGLGLAALLVLLPGLPLTMLAVFAQVIAALLMAPLLIFLVKLTSRRDLMGEHGNTVSARIRVWVIIGLMTGLCVCLLLASLPSFHP